MRHGVQQCLNCTEIETLPKYEEDYLELTDDQVLTRIELQSAGGTFHRIVTSCRAFWLSIKWSHSKSLMFDEY